MTDPTARRPDPLIILQRVEAAAVFLAAVIAYAATGGGWRLFALLILAPDLAMLGYALGTVWGARLYNLAHSSVGPVALGLLGWSLAVPTLLALALVWAAHVALDRALGFGLKRPGSFRDTHLGSLRAEGGPNLARRGRAGRPSIG